MAGRKHGGRGRGRGYPDRGVDRGRGRGARGRGRGRGRGAPGYMDMYEDDWDFATDAMHFRMSNLSRHPEATSPAKFPEIGVMPPRDVGGGCQALITRTITRDIRLLYRRPPFPAETVLDMAAVGVGDILAQTHQDQKNVR
jgi:hypothetical protein